MTLDQWLGLLLAGGIGGLITALTAAWTARRTAAREDKRQHAEEHSALAAGSKTIADAASIVVKLQDDQVAEFSAQIRALQAEVMALNTRMSREIETRMRVQAELEATTKRLETEMVAHATTKAQINELQQRVVNLSEIGRRGEELISINDELKRKLFDVSKGVMHLRKQLQDANIEPGYALDVPAIEAG